MASKNLKQLDVQNLYLLNMPSKLLLAGFIDCRHVGFGLCRRL